jgi:meso-butanediol dehydrogenase/(S,S)-butanediol dehydrogenase/diacetyl reductase
VNSLLKLFLLSLKLSDNFCFMLLSGKVIFLSGGSTGIGLDCAKAYALEGAHVALVSRNGEEAAAAAESLGDGHLGFACDVSKGVEVEAAIAKVLGRFGRLDAIHNNAGIATPSKPIHETSDDEWDALFNINLKSVLYTARHGFESLKSSKGCILNTSSLVGVIGQENHAVYTATKGGMNTLTKSMALDYAPLGIRVNAVCPAGTWTPMLRKWAEEQPDSDGINRYLDDIHPLGYCPDGDVIADACVFFLSDKSRFVTGHIMHVSGGAELGYRAAHAL